jgi:hypothetical protein
MRTEDGGIFVGPDDGKFLLNPVGGRMVVKVRDEDTRRSLLDVRQHDPAGVSGPTAPHPPPP